MLERMLAMTGVLRLEDFTRADALSRRLRHYQTVRVSETQRVVLIPPIGSFLVEWDETTIRLHIAAHNQWELDHLVADLNSELARGGVDAVCIDWVSAAQVPVPFR